MMGRRFRVRVRRFRRRLFYMGTMAATAVMAAVSVVCAAFLSAAIAYWGGLYVAEFLNNLE